MIESLVLAFLGIVCIVIGFAIGFYFFKKYEESKNEIDRLNVEIAKIRRERLAKGISRSIAGRLGKVYEAIFPHSPFSKYKPSDIFFFGGKPIDYIVFDGLSTEDIKQIVFLDVKSGTSELGKVEKQVRRIVKEEKDKIDFITVYTTAKKPLISEEDVKKILPKMKETMQKLLTEKVSAINSAR